MFPTRPLAAALLVAAVTAARAAPAPAAVPDPGASPPVPTSNYTDGTGDSAVDSLNASELDGNYRGPRYLVRPGTMHPIEGGAPPAAAAPFAVPPYPATRPVAPVLPDAPVPQVPAPPPGPGSGPSAVYPAGPPG